MYAHSNYWGDADVDHSQTIGGDTAKLLGEIYPPLVSAPLDVTESRLNKLSVQLSVPGENFLLLQNSQKLTIKQNIT